MQRQSGKNIIFFVAVLLSLMSCQLKTGKQECDSSVPDILFANVDDASPTFGAYGTKWLKTPSFDRVADQGILFANAYTPNAKCAPSQAYELYDINNDLACTTNLIDWQESGEVYCDVEDRLL